MISILKVACPQVCWAAFSLFLVGCTADVRKDQMETQDGSSPNDTGGMQSPGLMDAVHVRRVLVENGYDFERTLDQDSGYIVALAEHVADDVMYVVAIRAHDRSMRLMSKPVAIPDWVGRYPSAQWVSLDGDSIDHLSVMFDDMIQGPIRLELYRIAGGVLTTDYSDDHATCQPSRLEDLDGDQRPELISYVEDASGRDCDFCQRAMRRKFGITGAWVTVHRWSGEMWVSAETEYPEFYRQLAHLYERVMSWLPESPEEDHCRDLWWLGEDGKPFSQWAERARRLANQRRQ